MHQLAKKISLLWQRFIFTVVGMCIMFSLGGCGQNWGWYVVNPTTPAGQQNLKFLIDGLYYTIALSLTAICISIIVGLLIALPGLSTQRVPRGINRVYVELIRSIPLLVLILGYITGYHKLPEYRYRCFGPEFWPCRYLTARSKLKYFAPGFSPSIAVSMKQRLPYR